MNLYVILTSEDSFYYDIIANIVKNTRHSTIAGFGINIGFNSLTYGANIIRENEKKFGYNIPWLMCSTLKIMLTITLQYKK